MVSRSTIESAHGHVSFFDRGTGPNVVFLHALGRSAEDWNEIVDDLSHDWRCVVVDLPGHGDSTRLSSYTFEALATAAETVIEHLKLDRLSIVAHSMGAMVAWIIAPTLGQRLTHLVVEDTPAPTDRHAYPDVPEHPSESVGYDWACRRQIFNELNRPNPAWRTEVPRISAPTLLIAGEQDDAEMSETSALLPTSTLVEIPGGHWVHEQHPAEYIAVVRDFLGR